MQYTLDQSPFSRRGSYLQIERGFDLDSDTVLLGSARRSIWRPVHGGGFGSHFFSITLAPAGTDPSETDAAPSQVVCTPWSCSGGPDTPTNGRAPGRWSAAIADAQTMVFRLVRPDVLSLRACRGMSWAESRDNGRLVVVGDADAGCCHHFRLLTPGRLRLAFEAGDVRHGKAGAAHHRAHVIAEPDATSDGELELAYRNLPLESRGEEPVPSFAAAELAARKDYRRWLQRRPRVAEAHNAAAAFAWFMLWNQRVPAGGGIGREAIIMSRFWMNRVWAWDACFSALGVADADPQLAWDQLLLHLDHQTPDGQVPDSVDDGGACFGWVKPPVQGWAAMRLLRRLGLEASIGVLPELYDRLLAWTHWWYAWRCDRPDGLCRYLHGNDSGWDNSTVFAEPGPVITPDLQAFLALQWKALSRIAMALGRRAEAEDHAKRATRHTQAMQTALRVGDRLGYIDPSGRLRDSSSGLTRMAVVLGTDLDEPIRQQLREDLAIDGPFLGAAGLATEARTSADYQDDGYWRGPVWAPEQFIAIDGLLRSGDRELAQEHAARFCRACAGADHVMHENHDASTGRGLRSPAYSWTAAVFIRLAEWLNAPTPAMLGAPKTQASPAVPRPRSTPQTSRV
ncbi:MAG: trehalase family glycosidase [Planctomycetota bacterium]